MTDRAHLYVNSKGFAVRRHSYSAGDVFNFCAQKYKLSKVDGWQEKRKSAAFAFGIALENAVRYYHENNLDLAGAIKEFSSGEKGWDLVKDDKELAYTATEVSWDALTASGREMLKLYSLRLSSFPIAINPVPKFQVQYNKEVFPGTKLAGIEFVAYVDMIAAAYWKNVLGPNPDPTTHQLAPMNLPKKILIDIKTAGVPLDSTPGILALDQQLRTYSWVTDIPDVAFLWFQKVNRGLERGSYVQLLNKVGSFEAGTSAVVIKYQEFEPARPADPAKPKSKPKEEIPEETWIVTHYDVLEEMFGKCGKGQTKNEKDARNIFIRENATKVNKSDLTKQRIQFQMAHISLEDRTEAATQVGHDIAQIHHANENNYFPKQGSIRGFNSKCNTCAYRGNCLNLTTLRDGLVERKDSDFDIIEDSF